MKSDSFQCEFCVFKAVIESDLKRHRRDKHDVSTKPKKRRQLERDIQEEMEIDDDQYIVENVEVDILLERSKMQDEKVRKKEQKLNEQEERYKQKIISDKLDDEKKEKEYMKKNK